MRGALVLQARSCASLGSPMYAAVLDGLVADFDRRGITWQLLDGRTERPVHDAVPLRLLAAVHRIVLRGDAPALAARFPSAGGDGTAVPIDDVLRVLTADADEIDASCTPPCRPTRWPDRRCSRPGSPSSPDAGDDRCGCWRSVPRRG